MPRVKRGVAARTTAQEAHPRIRRRVTTAHADSGLLKTAREAVEKGWKLRLSRPPSAQAPVPSALDRTHQRRRPGARAVV